ncbi:SemiSWEET family sugar transporter [Candidatus Methylocalor cossyra]|uniref:MtN3 and saliva related transmembrane protein n=1 Tax=Candidatus Methylocalor cossyra TaxID=3108543 RepID=A0ABP1CBF8_9GAMM
MSPESLDVLGLVAGGLTTFSFVPQVWKLWRTQSGADVSYGMFLLFSLGVLLWLVYGVLLNATPIIVANAATLFLALLVVALKFRYRR